MPSSYCIIPLVHHASFNHASKPAPAPLPTGSSAAVQTLFSPAPTWVTAVLVYEVRAPSLHETCRQEACSLVANRGERKRK